MVVGILKFEHVKAHLSFTYFTFQNSVSSLWTTGCMRFPWSCLRSWVWWSEGLAPHPCLCPEQLSFHLPTSPVCKDHHSLPQERAQDQVSPGWWSQLVVQAKTQPTKRSVKGFPRPEIWMPKSSLFPPSLPPAQKLLRAIQGCLELVLGKPCGRSFMQDGVKPRQQYVWAAGGETHTERTNA